MSNVNDKRTIEKEALHTLSENSGVLQGGFDNASRRNRILETCLNIQGAKLQDIAKSLTPEALDRVNDTCEIINSLASTLEQERHNREMERLAGRGFIARVFGS